jgi:hypothetical protein
MAVIADGRTERPEKSGKRSKMSGATTVPLQL